MSEPEKPQIDDSSLLVTLTVGQLREIVCQASNGNGHHDGDHLLNTKQAANRLGVLVSWISEKTRKGELPCVHLGHYIRFKPEDLDQYIKDHRK